MEKLTHNPNYSIGHYMQQILPNIKNPVIFEIGVHWAEDTPRLMNQCTSVPWYYGFEPDPRNMRKIRQQKLPYHFHINEAAVGNIDGKVTLHLSDGKHPVNGNLMTGANSIREPKEVKKRHAWIDFKDQIEVECCKLDTFCKEHNIDHIDFIWADMQGAEYDMLLGAKDILRNTSFLYLEYSEVELYDGQKNIRDYINLLNRNGEWTIVHKFNMDVLIQNLQLQ